MNTLVVLPSYNEKENIISLITHLLALTPDTHVCVVDDSSPDGTSRIVQEFIDKKADGKRRVHLIVRSKKDGRGGAVRAGMEWGLQQAPSFEIFIEMDCDFSHEPKSIPVGIDLLQKECDIVLGSRYPDGKIEGWPLTRRVFSFFANLLARILINWSIADYTNGFRLYSRQAAIFMLSKPQKNTGYIYLSETLSYFINGGFRIKSFPIYFVNRQRGASNTGLTEVQRALTGIFSIAWQHRFGPS